MSANFKRAKRVLRKNEKAELTAYESHNAGSKFLFFIFSQDSLHSSAV
jgi:hypothetical protein